MLSQRFLSSFLICCLWVASVGRAGEWTVTVQLAGMKSDAGTVDVALHTEPAAFPMRSERAHATARAGITNGLATVVFTNLVSGAYALAAYHDVNGNQKLDTNLLGIPREPTGASNGARGRMGPPSFRDARFLLETNRTLRIVLK